jgi:DNA repair exonuclease SbcCD ATPase subunit
MSSEPSSLKSWKQSLDKAIHLREIAQSEVEKFKKEEEAASKRADQGSKLISIFTLAANQAQQQVSVTIENIVTSALVAVFGAGYSFRIKFVQRRNSTEADMVMVKGENEVDPLDNSGLGPANLIAIALRAAFIALDGKVARFMSLDEPTAALMVKKQVLAGGVLRTLCDKLGFQILLTTHSPELAGCGDVVYYVEQNKNGRSKITRLASPELAQEMI